MNRTLIPMFLATLCLLATTACSPVTKGLIGDPENPYPRQTPPRMGDIVHLPTGTLVTPEQLLAVANDARIVYVGETHDNVASHRLQLQILQGLADRHPGRQALGMEMFVRSQQPVLDRWIAGELNEKTFIKEVRWSANWDMDFAYYRDLLLFARDRHIPIIALNAEKSLVRALRSTPPDQLVAEQRVQLPDMDLTDPYQRGMVAAIFSDHSHGALQLDAFVRAQTLWDETMAESVARYLASSAGLDRHLLVVAGGHHVNFGFGIPRRVFRRLPASSLLIGGQETNVGTDKSDRIMNVTPPQFPMIPYDFLAYIAYEDLPKTGVRLGVMFEPSPTGRGVVVKAVTPGSNAERAGLQPGDVLLDLDGEPLTEGFDLSYAVQQKRSGDRGVLQVERQGKIMQVAVLFRAVDGDGSHGKQ